MELESSAKSLERENESLRQQIHTLSDGRLRSGGGDCVDTTAMYSKAEDDGDNDWDYSELGEVLGGQQSFYAATDAKRGTKFFGLCDDEDDDESDWGHADECDGFGPSLLDAATDAKHGT